MSAANADFAFKLFAAMNKTEGDNGTSLLLSPISAAFALAMLNNGAANKTREELMSLLCGDVADINEMNDYYRTLLSELPNLDKTAILKIANSQWTIPEFKLLAEYSNILSNSFNAEMNTLDFSTAVSDINDWCNRNTNGLIPKLFEEISSEIQSILINAVYFKGVWEEKFIKRRTREGEFTNYDGSKSTASYMRAKMNAFGHKGKGYSVLKLPFGDETFCMQILLPDEGVSLSDCIASLDTKSWLGWERGWDSEFDIMLPKFSVEYSGSLVGALRQLGLESAFDCGVSDFTNMSVAKFFVGEIHQTSVFSINEDGAEGAAVSDCMVLGCMPRESKEFHVTRPFLYIVRENSSNTILFIGRITKF
ncbi:MAG: serpin family protein [Bacteroidales bacterium]|nr:serpin family protein [Bacteroidales bacterium]